MDFFNQPNLHHAYLLVGRPEDILTSLRRDLGRRLEVSDPLASPDYVEEEYSLFGIKDSQSLRQRQTLGAFGQKGRFFVLTISAATIEAQNALLKTFEEPAAGVHFFIILRSEDVFLATLKSRFIIVRFEVRADADQSVLVDNFLKMSPPARLDYVRKNYLKNKEKNKSDIFRFLDDLEKGLYHFYQAQGRQGEPKALTEIGRAKKNLANPRASVRLILEHLALVV